jgi:hypothetical protein
VIIPMVASSAPLWTLVIFFAAELLFFAGSLFLLLSPRRTLQNGVLGRIGDVFEARPWVFWLALVLFASSIPQQVITLFRARRAAVFVGGLLFPWLSFFALATIVRLRAAAKRSASAE